MKDPDTVRGKTIVVTGTFRRSRQALTAALVELGARVTSDVSRSTDILFAGDKAGSKLDRAKTLGVRILGEPELEALLSAAAGGGAGARPWTDWAAAEGGDALAAARALIAGDWAGFVAARDLEPLRALLARAEAQHGVTAIHRAAGEKLRTLGATLMHPFVHATQVRSFGLSSDGRYLATGAWVGDEYARGGSLQVWELASGRMVNALPQVEGGVGWPDFAGCIQWAPGDRAIGAVFNTNGIGAFDPAGDRSAPRADAYVTDGWSRPPGWCWAPDGVRALIACWGYGVQSQLPGAIVSLDHGSAHRHARWLTDARSAELPQEDLAIGYGDPVCWSADDHILFTPSSHLIAVHAGLGTVAWVRDRSQLPGEVSLCADGRRLLVIAGRSLTLLATATGEPVGTATSDITDAAVVHGAAASGGRFVLYGSAPPAGKRKKGAAAPASHAVEVWQDGTRLASLRVSLQAGHYTQPDLAPIALSPDGTSLAVLTPAQVLEVYAVSDPARPRVTAGPFTGTLGVFYGAHGTIAVAGPESVAFVDGASGTVRGAFRLLVEAPGARPLEQDGYDNARFYPIDPCFALENDSGRVACVAFPEGAIACPASHRDQLDDTVALVVERRHAWPLRWSDVPVTTTVAEALAGLTSPTAKALRKIFPVRAEKAAAAPTAFPPAERGTLDTLFEVLEQSLTPLHTGWHLHIAETLRRTAQTCARIGRSDLAVRALDGIPADYLHELVGGAGWCAALLADRDAPAARALLARAEEAATRARPTYGLAHLTVAAALGAARAALGDARGADAAFAAARKHLGDEHNPGQNAAELAGALVLGGYEADAIALLVARAAEMTRSMHFVRSATDLLLQRGGAAAWEKLIRELLAAGVRINDHALPESILRELGARNEWLRVDAALAIVGSTWLEPYQQRIVRGLYQRGLGEEAFARADRYAETADRAGTGRWLGVLAALDPARVRDRVLAAQGSAEISVATLVRIGAHPEALAQAKQNKALSRVAAVADALLAVPADAAPARELLALIDAVAPAALVITRDTDAVPWARLSAAVRRAGDVPRAQKYLAIAMDTLKDATQRRWVHEAALRTLLDEGDLTGAHEALGRFTRATRHRPVRDLAEACARQGHYAAAAQLLAQLPDRDMNDRPQAAFACFMQAAYREHYGPGVSWSL